MGVETLRRENGDHSAATAADNGGEAVDTDLDDDSNKRAVKCDKENIVVKPVNGETSESAAAAA